jgi:DNA-binding transcriptional LysR family regulator
MTLRKRLVESGQFLTILSTSIPYFGTNRLRMKALPVTLPVEPHPIEVITVRGRTPNPIAKVFIDELRVLVQPLAKRGNAKAKPMGKTDWARRRS